MPSLAPNLLSQFVEGQLDLGRRAFFALTDMKVAVDETVQDVINVDPDTALASVASNLTAIEVLAALLCIAARLVRRVEIAPTSPLLLETMPLRIIK